MSSVDAVADAVDAVSAVASAILATDRAADIARGLTVAVDPLMNDISVSNILAAFLDFSATVFAASLIAVGSPEAASVAAVAASSAASAARIAAFGSNCFC